ncbi:DUF6538 domain-containing protein [Roseibium sp.]|uniref:DUF6538 domain-containing protein n=1 Tax=Roseibium sp. TaxID=1936156 RepID=UPI003299A4B1
MQGNNRHLRQRGDKWQYARRVPAHVVPFLGRARIEVSLKTDSLEVARMRRDAMEEADDKHWSALLAQTPLEAAEAQYKADKARCLALGFAWKSLTHLVDAAPLEEVIDRVMVARQSSRASRAQDANAVLGTARRPSPEVSRVLKTFFEDIAPDKLRTKSPQQQRTYKKVKQRAVNNFIAVCGDKAVDEITREDGQRFFSWWQDRVVGTTTTKMSPNSGNRDVGNMRKLLDDYYSLIGEEDRPNPFRNMRFRERKFDQVKRPPFPASWIRDRILTKEAFDGLNLQAACIAAAMIETGCRPSELCNLPPERIILSADVPYIDIEYQEERELKTESSIRRIPLVGIALLAMKLCPKGFPRYRDKEENFSQIVRKHFRKRNLFPSDRHVIYSLRHSFEDRMKEGGLDAELRRLLMGHTIHREEYGEGGSLAYRQQELLKIALPFGADVLEGTHA